MKGLLYDVEFCTGCFSCTVACKQEHGFDADTWGKKVLEQIYTYPNGRVQIDNVPFPTKLCDLCAERITSGEDDKPACVKACQGAIIYYGEIEELVKLMPTLKRPMLWAGTREEDRI